jgi:tetratricopeptide (TPR) repeat protein
MSPTQSARDWRRIKLDFVHVNEAENIIRPPDGSEHDPPAAAARLPVGVVAVLATMVLGGAVFAIYGWFLHAPFIFDDIPCIVNNPSIMHLSPLWGAAPGSGPLWPPQDFTTAGRPLVNLTLALNFGFDGLDPTGFHFVNVLLHVITSLLVWVVVRRTLTLDYFENRFRHVAGPLALLVAILWAVHPLQTEAVEYVSQRTELLMGLFYLATLAASLRYFLATSRVARGAWCLLAAVSCLAGMACKEVMVSAPVVVLLYERTFIAGTLRRALFRSWPLYLGLALGWILLFALNWHGPRSASAGFHLDVAPYVWWCTQAKVLLLYLKLACWPWPLVIHYDVPYLDSLRAAWPWALAGLVLGGSTLVLLWQRYAAGFVMASVLLILSPTLVVPIISEVAAERRMYLPLAPLVALATGAVYVAIDRVCRRLADRPSQTSSWRVAIATTTALGLSIAISFSVLSIYRLTYFKDALELWQDAVARQPYNHVAHINYGVELLNRKQLEQAIEQFEQALQLAHKDFAKIHMELGTALSLSGRSQDAIPHFKEALQLVPEEPAKVHQFLAISLVNVGRAEDAISHFQQAIDIGPDSGELRRKLALAYAAAGRDKKAISCFESALRAGFDSAELYNDLGMALVRDGRPADAIVELQHALRRRPDSAQVHYNLGVAWTAADQSQRAVAEFQQALRMQPDYPAVHKSLGLALVRANQAGAAVTHLEQALRQEPDSAELHYNLGVALVAADRAGDAIIEFDRALRLQPDYPAAKTGLAQALDAQQHSKK